jgi:hypothetical protein
VSALLLIVPISLLVACAIAGERFISAAHRLADVALRISGARRTPAVPPPWWGPGAALLLDLLFVPWAGLLWLAHSETDRRVLAAHGARGRLLGLHRRRAITEHEVYRAVDVLNAYVAGELY